MSPRSASGQKSAERAPTTTRAAPERTMSHWSSRSPAERREWNTATASPKRERKRPTVWAVSEISGTSTQAERPWARTRSMAVRYTSVLPEPVTPSTSTTSPDALSVARAIASRAFCCPAVSSLGADAFAEESVVEPSHPRQLRRSSTATTPRFSSERIVADRSPFMRLSSRVVTGPQESASMSWRWRTARSAGSNDRPSSVRLTHRAVTGVTAGGSYAYEPSSRRTTLPAPPGGNSRRRHSESGATYSRLIQNASSAEAAENAGAATTSRTGLMRAGSSASAPGSSCSVSARATTYPASTRRPNGTSAVAPTWQASPSEVGTPYAKGSDSARAGMSITTET